jgi:uncharacterized repeat protein (TIGR01451 family)
MSMTVNGPATGFENFPLNYQLVIANAGPGPATNVQIFDTLPLGTDFLPLNSLQSAGYPLNDQWRDLNNGLIARGPFNIAVGQAITVLLNVQVPVGAASTTLTDFASAKDKTYNTVASGSKATLILAGVPTYTSTATITPTFSVSPSSTRTSTISPSPSTSPTATQSSTVTRSPSPSASPTPAPVLALLKSSNRVAVGVAGDVITYVLRLQDLGGGAATGVSVWDSLPANASFLAGAGSSLNGGVLSWSLPSLGAGATQNFTFSVSFTGAGTEVDNQAAAQASNHPGLLSNLQVIAVGTPFTPTSTPSPTATASPTPIATASPTPALGPPQLALSIVRDDGLAWPTYGQNDLHFTISFQSLSCACQTATDLIMTVQSDLEHGNAELDMIQGFYDFDPYALGGPGDPLSPRYWKQVNAFVSNGVTRGRYSLSPTAALKSSVFARVQPDYVDQTVTSKVVLSSVLYGLAVSATVQTYLSAGPPPTLTPTQTPAATPVAALGKIAAYPQPAVDTICFGYTPPQGGELKIAVYNAAFQLVAEVSENVQAGQFQQSCVGIGPLSPGIYVYKAKVGDFSFPTSQFGVLR